MGRGLLASSKITKAQMCLEAMPTFGEQALSNSAQDIGHVVRLGTDWPLR